MRILKDPLLHFILLGAAIFLIYNQVNDSSNEVSDDKIIVTQGRINQMIDNFENTWKRKPSKAELQSLIDDYVIEEIYYRQAIALGMDQDDTMIRRRLRQKLEFISDNMASIAEPTDQELTEYLTENGDKFRQPAKYTLHHLYFSPEKHGENLQQYADKQKEVADSGGKPQGDHTMLPKDFRLATAKILDGSLGAGFSEGLQGMKVGSWQGPIPSRYGLHLVFIEEKKEGYVPELDTIKERVKVEWDNDNRDTMRDDINQRFKEKYEVVIEWPNSL